MINFGDDDDDLIVDLEDDDAFLPDDTPTIADKTAGTPKPAGLPDDDELIPDDDEMFGVEAPARPAAAAADDDDEDEEDELVRELQSRDAQLREVQARSIWENGQLQAAQADQQLSAANLSLNTLGEKLQFAYEALAAARENGDTSAEIQIQNNIEEIKNLKAQFEHAKSQIPDPRSVLEAARTKALSVYNSQTPGKKVGEGIQASNPLATKWAKANGWMASNAKANQTVIKVSNDLMAEGKNPNSKAFYAELARRVAAKHPDIQVKTFQAKTKASKPQRKSPVAPSGSSAPIRPSGAQGKTRYTLTVGEQQVMRRHNLDPKNPVHQKYWAKSRMKSAPRAST